MVDFAKSGRMLSLSKSQYRQSHPKHKVVFNANIFTKEQGRIWYGDLNITLDITALKELAKSRKQDIYVFSEMDNKFTDESDPRWANFVVCINPRGDIIDPVL